MKFSAFGYEITLLEINPLGMAFTPLQPNEYDQFYFDFRSAQGEGSAKSVLAGFSDYKRWYRTDGPNSLGEYWKDRASAWVNHLALSNKTVLELACAKGFLVKDLRDAGVNAIGMDVSSYALGQCEEGVAPYLIQGDVRTGLGQFSNKQFDVVLSFRLIECLTDTEITQLITDCNRIGKKQVHVITVGDDLNNQYYNWRTLQQWLADFNWPRGTVLAAYNAETNFVTK